MGHFFVHALHAIHRFNRCYHVKKHEFCTGQSLVWRGIGASQSEKSCFKLHDYGPVYNIYLNTNWKPRFMSWSRQQSFSLITIKEKCFCLEQDINQGFWFCVLECCTPQNLGSYLGQWNYFYTFCDLRYVAMNSLVWSSVQKEPLANVQWLVPTQHHRD